MFLWVYLGPTTLCEQVGIDTDFLGSESCVCSLPEQLALMWESVCGKEGGGLGRGLFIYWFETEDILEKPDQQAQGLGPWALGCGAVWGHRRA